MKLVMGYNLLFLTPQTYHHWKIRRIDWSRAYRVFMMCGMLPYSDKRKQLTNHPNKEKVMFLDWTYHILLPFQVWSRYTHPAERYLSQDIIILHWCQCTWQTHFAHLQEPSFSRVASFCQSMAEWFCWEPEGHFCCMKSLAFLALNWTSLNSINALLVLRRQYCHCSRWELEGH